MFFTVEVLDLILWCIQELGVLLSVGAAAAVLVGYIVALRDRKVTENEARYSRRVHMALYMGLAFMILSGIAIVALHLSQAQAAIVSQPVFLFKWLLILLLLGAYLFQRNKPYMHSLIEGAVGATWAMLFLIHSVAPAVSWASLFMLYGAVLVGFVVLWSAIVRLVKERLSPAPAAAPIISKIPMPAALPKVIASAPKPVPAAPVVPPAPISKPAAPPAPVMAQAALAPVPPKPIAPAPIAKAPPAPEDPHHSLWLPAIHVMPKDAAQLESKSHITPLGALTKNA
jgi:hypothetical protein